MLNRKNWIKRWKITKAIPDGTKTPRKEDSANRYVESYQRINGCPRRTKNILWTTVGRDKPKHEEQ
jgi:hypothetical protein